MWSRHYADLFHENILEIDLKAPYLHVNIAMRKILSLFLLLLICVFSCKKKEADVVADVKKKQQEINRKLKDYTQKHVDDITSPGGGNITGYYRDDEIKKILAEHYTDTNRAFTEYYFDDGMLILVLKQNYIYNKPVFYTEEKAKAFHDSVWYDDKKTRLETSSFYFNKNKLVKWAGPGNKYIPANTTAFINEESELWAETVILIKELKEQTQ